MPGTHSTITPSDAPAPPDYLPGSSEPADRFTFEALGAIADYAVYGVTAHRWKSYVLPDAHLDILDAPVAAGDHWARVVITETRLGWTAGYDLQAYQYGSGYGGGWHPNFDRVGWYLWTTRQAAIHHGACELWHASRYTKSADRVRRHFARLLYDVTEPTGADYRRRLISHAEAQSLALSPTRPEPYRERDPDVLAAIRLHEIAYEARSAGD